MRICYVIEAAGGGSGQVVIDLARWHGAHGDHVTVIHPTSSRATQKFLDSLQSVPNVRLIATPMQRGFGFHDLIDLAKLYACLRNAGPFDIINAHSSKAGGLVRMMRFLFPKAIVVYTPHAFMTMAPNAFVFYTWAEKLLSHLCDMIICVSAQEHRHARTCLSIPEGKLRTIPNGIRLEYQAERSSARTAMNVGAKDYVVGFTGRLVRQKNPDRMVEAFAVAAKKNPALRLIIIGDGKLRLQTEQKLAAYQLDRRSHFISSSYARDFMPGFDCFLCSSDFESFGLVLVEALAAGVPVVTTPVGIAQEAVIEGKTGFITPDFKPASLARGLEQLAALPPDARQSMSEACKAHARHWNLEHMAQQTAALYHELLARRDRSM